MSAADPTDETRTIRFSFGTGHPNDAIVEVPFTTNGFSFQSIDKEALFQYFQETFSSGEKQSVLVIGNPGVALQTVSFAAENRSVEQLNASSESFLSQNDRRYAIKEIFNLARYTSLKQGGVLLLLDLSFSELDNASKEALASEIHQLQVDTYPVFLCVLVEDKAHAASFFEDPLLFHTLLELSD